MNNHIEYVNNEWKEIFKHVKSLLNRITISVITEIIFRLWQPIPFQMSACYGYVDLNMHTSFLRNTK